MVFEPRINLWPTGVSHYYGDIIRQVFVVTAVFMLVTAPFYSDDLKAHIPFYVAGALVLFILAALTNPHNQYVLLADAIAAGAGAALYEMWALGSYDTSTLLVTALRQSIAILFLIAFYFSMKTVRAFAMHQIGKWAQAGEFDDGDKKMPAHDAMEVEPNEDTNDVHFEGHKEKVDDDIEHHHMKMNDG